MAFNSILDDLIEQNVTPAEAAALVAEGMIYDPQMADYPFYSIHPESDWDAVDARLAQLRTQV